MKKVKKLTKGNFKLVIGIIVGMVIAGTTVYAATIISGNDVSYSNTTSGLKSTTVQEAIDEIYEKSKTHCPDGYKCTKLPRYAFGTPTTSSTTDYTTLGRNVFARLEETGKLGICIIRNEKLFCINSNDFDNSKSKITEAFEGVGCRMISSEVLCEASDLLCHADSDGNAYCRDKSDNSVCAVNSDGSVECGW